MIAWQRYGESGPDLVLVHGWGMHGGLFTELAERLAASCQVHVPDLPGHGGSDWDVDADWAEALLADAPERAAWVGWSLGIQPVIEIARRYPERVAAVGGMAATPCFVQRDDWRHAMSAETFAAFEAGLAETPAATLKRFVGLQVQGSANAREEMRILRASLADAETPNPEALAAGLRRLVERDLRGELAELNLSMSWLLGEADSLIPADIAKQLPGEVSIMPGAAHLPFISDIAATEYWLNRLLEQRADD